jgi:CrcB protein
MEWLAAVLTHPLTLVFVGSGVGGVCRFALARWIDSQPWAGGLPWGTFVVNVTGSFVLALIVLLTLERFGPSARPAYLLLGTGFCGGYTTFSTLSWESFQLARGGSWPWAVANLAGSCAAGFAGVLLAAMLVHVLIHNR